MKKLLQIIIVPFLIGSCNAQQGENTTITTNLQEQSTININATTLAGRVEPPSNFQRVKLNKNSFSYYLRHINLRPHNSRVKYYNATTKAKNGVYLAVVDLDIGSKDLHQCADAIMRLKAEYHWNQKEYDKIHFNFTNGFRVEYTEWMKGRRIKVNGNRVKWVNRNNPSNTYGDFWNYMELVFMYAGTSSLSKEMKKVKFENMQVGDVLILGGFPGHAVIVMDMAEEQKTGKKLYLLGQSYMPAQEIQILINPMNKDLSPWYEINSAEIIRSPEWDFSRTDLKRFIE